MFFFVPCTGRALGEMAELVKNNEDIRYIICSNNEHGASYVLENIIAKKIKNILKKATLYDII